MIANKFDPILMPGSRQVSAITKFVGVDMNSSNLKRSLCDTQEVPKEYY